MNSVIDPTRFPTRTNYVNLATYAGTSIKMGSNAKLYTGTGGGPFYKRHPMVVDGVSCRQLYLRSAYTFSRKESIPERTKKCFGRVKERVASMTSTRIAFRPRQRRRRRRLAVVKRVKERCREALCSIFSKLLSCIASVDVVENE